MVIVSDPPAEVELVNRNDQIRPRRRKPAGGAHCDTVQDVMHLFVHRSSNCGRGGGSLSAGRRPGLGGIRRCQRPAAAALLRPAAAALLRPPAYSGRRWGWGPRHPDQDSESGAAGAGADADPAKDILKARARGRVRSSCWAMPHTQLGPLTVTDKQ